MIVALLWIGTPFVVAIPVWITANPRAELGPGAGVIIGTGVTYFFYIFAGVIAGLIMLFINRPVGAGLFAGTGLGALAGFVTCQAVGAVVGGLAG